jgi:hypothetical protein
MMIKCVVLELSRKEPTRLQAIIMPNDSSQYVGTELSKTKMINYLYKLPSHEMIVHKNLQEVS